MKCKDCGQANKDGRRYCGKCGKPLGNACEICKYENEEGDTFCGGCGRDLRKEADAPPKAAGADSHISDSPRKGGLKIDPSKVLYVAEEIRQQQPVDGKGKDTQSSEKPQEKESAEGAKLSQESIERLFEDKSKNEDEQGQKEPKVEAETEKKDKAARYVDKKSSFAYDMPISQDEVDKLFADYKRKHNS